MLFYRTNHAWYFTTVYIDKSSNNNDDININDINRMKNLDWILINIYESISKIINSSNEKPEPQHEVIINWLKLSELMYM